MKKVEHFFDINMILMTVFSALESEREEKEIELVYDIDATVPKELRGDADSVSHVLTQLLLFVFQNTENKEVILALRAPEDFLYEESITFEIDHLDMSRVKVESFLEARLKPILERLEGSAFYNELSGKIALSLPFRLKDFGNRRYYRLPDIGMLGKKVLLISKSKIMAESLRKMFRYFLYEVDAGSEEYKQRGSNLAQYDIFVLEDSLVTEGIEALVKQIQEKYDLKFVILGDAAYPEIAIVKTYISAFLVKPIMQESIYELIIALYESDIKDRKIRKEIGKPIINMEKYIIDAFNKSEEAYIQMETIKEEIARARRKNAPAKGIEADDDKAMALNTTEALQQARKSGMDYRKELEDFLEIFDKSDLYFRDITQKKAVWQIKEFAIDLEKKAKIIGAERIAKLAEKISLLFVYDNLDMLPVYAGKYHLELKRLFSEIKRYLAKH